MEELKQEAPELTAGYIMPFNIVGPPLTSADFLTMEYSTINRNFVSSAKTDHKDVFVWTPNDDAEIQSDAVLRCGRHHYRSDGYFEPNPQ